jgi:uncharacterized FAD-dependent dehydrogenase
MKGMTKEIELALSPAEAADEAAVRERAARALRLAPGAVAVRPLRRSIDARGGRPLVRLRVEVSTGAPKDPEPAIIAGWRPVDEAPRVIVVGAGPAGYFAALELIAQGLKPVVLDRGADVRARRRDLRAIQQFGQVNANSNYCFGEGGAGAYSDGKLYTRSHKRGNIENALRLLVEHGAKSDILIDAHPHIGSNKLPGIVANIRQTILSYGGEVRFECLVNDLIVEGGRTRGVLLNNGEDIRGEAVILATGHSARDIYALLHRRNFTLEAKPFALGVRVEHPQAFIDYVQYGQRPRETHLPAASYRLTTQVRGRGVFSFCMCPGGLIVPAATSPGEIVVNGMSMSRRDSAYANSGIVTAVELEDLRGYHARGVFAGMALQEAVEHAMFEAGDGGQRAPAQRLIDFTSGKISVDLPKSSYIPGLFRAPLHEMLPTFIYERLREGFLDFGRKMPGYHSNEAVVVGVESRTSAPLRIPRDPLTMMHRQAPGLFPAGEGAGYAGGIISAALDGQNVARAVARYCAIVHST